MTSRRILFIDQYASIGGGQKVLLQLVEISLQNGHQAVILAPAKGDLESCVRDRYDKNVSFINLDEIPLTHGKKGLKDLFILFASFFRALKHRSLFAWSDVIYVNGPRFYFMTFIFSFVFKKKYFYHIHLNHSSIEKFLLYIIGQHPRTEKIILSSNFLYDRLVGTLPFMKKSRKLIVLQNSLSSTFSSLSFVDRWKGKSLTSLTCIGRIDPEKGQSLFIELARCFPQWQFVLMGSSDFSSAEYEMRLRKEAPNNVVFRGKVQDVISAINESSIQVSIVPSQCEEAFGLAAIESMACSLFTITSGKGELESISVKTGAWIAHNVEEFKALLCKLDSINSYDRLNMTKKMYESTMNTYLYAQYQNQWLSLIAGDSSGFYQKCL
jgi:glycosyltransferase involved in cell wall biosynthesis